MTHFCVIQHIQIAGARQHLLHKRGERMLRREVGQIGDERIKALELEGRLQQRRIIRRVAHDFQHRRALRRRDARDVFDRRGSDGALGHVDDAR